MTSFKVRGKELQSTFKYNQRLNCDNFPLTVTKVARLQFWESALKCLNAGVRYPYNLPVRNKSPLKFWTNLVFHGSFSCKIRKFKNLF